jgi:hypothetical protein
MNEWIMSETLSKDVIAVHRAVLKEAAFLDHRKVFYTLHLCKFKPIFPLR